MATQTTAEADTPLDRDKTALKTFLTQLEDFLGVVITDRPELLGTHIGAIDRAWPTLIPRFEEVRQAVDNDFRDEVNNVPDRLKAHGLRGEQLALKLDVFEAALSDFLDELDGQDDAERYWRTWVTRLRGSGIVGRAIYGRVRQRLVSVRAAGRKVLRGKFGWVVDAADVIVASLGEALAFLPGVGGGAAAIGEFKETVKVGLYEPDDVDKPVRQEALSSERVRGLRMKVQSGTEQRRAGQGRSNPD